MSDPRSSNFSRLTAVLCASAISFGAVVLISNHSLAESAVAIPPPVTGAQTAGEKLVLAGGCFWGVQGVFQHVKGVTNAVSGYAGGKQETAHYEQVGSGATGHAESVEITFDPSIVSYGELLQIYFSVAHDPTQINRQGPDSGTQYRSEIFTLNDAQRRTAANYIAQLDKAKVFGRPIATRVEPLEGFYAAEGYHQNYATLHPDAGYIAHNDLPKIENLKKMFPGLYQAQAKLVAVAAQ